MPNLQHDILKKIQNGEIDMKPRWHFVLKGILTISGTFLLALIVIYLLSFVIFFLKQTGVGFAPLYGFRGLSIFVMSSPWILVSVAGVFMFSLYLLVTRYSFSYRHPLIYTLVGIVLIVVTASVAIGHSTMHSRADQYLHERGVSLFEPLYRSVDRKKAGLTLGTIATTTETGFLLQTPEGETLTVVITPNTKRPPEKHFVVGEHVLVIGGVKESTIEALGVRPAPGERVFQNSEMHKPPRP